eukprot:TRINITY_DN750_c0_g2_i2.p1 TRINITY_DN750_c0_g2~~TRINITY_DN750_c0_g2_i2.p1  ORF type:complete len:345 (+),score=87.29 TRINITY_DN750_c0_g2_i2:147-1181(+)
MNSPHTPASQMTTDERREYIAKLRQERQEREIGRTMSSSLTGPGTPPLSVSSLTSLNDTPRSSSTPFSPPPSRSTAAVPRTDVPLATQSFPLQTVGSLTYTNSTISSPSATPLPSTSNTSPLSTPSETPRVSTPLPVNNTNNNNISRNINNSNSNFSTQNLEPLSPPRLPTSSLLSSPPRTATKAAPPTANLFTASQLGSTSRATQDFLNNNNTTITDSPSIFSKSAKAPGSIASINNSQKSYSLWAEEKLRWWEQESQKMQQFLQSLDDEWSKHREHTRRELEDEIQALRHESLVKAGLAQNSLSITSPFEAPASPTKTRREDNYGSSNLASASRASSMFAPR